MRDKLIGVLAATPVDTKMGVEVVCDAGYRHLSRHLSETPAEQQKLQLLHRDELSALALRACVSFSAYGAACVFLYCNSLAGAIDLAAVREKSPIPVITPLDVYAELAKKHGILGVMAANCQSLSAIERAAAKSNPESFVCGFAGLPLVEAIEAEREPAEIMEKFKLNGVIQSLCGMGAEVLVLGCTHFPYLKEAITKASPLPVIDPAQRMLEMIQ